MVDMSQQEAAMPTAVSMAPTMPAMTAIAIVITVAFPIAVTAALSATVA